jgi:hypothetical protein
MKGKDFGPLLHIANEVPSKEELPKLLHGLAGFNKQLVSLDDVRGHLPAKTLITWVDELKGDKFMGYEIRGHGAGFRAWIKVKHGDFKSDLTSEQRQQLLDEAIQAKEIFFPS